MVCWMRLWPWKIFFMHRHVVNSYKIDSSTRPRCHGYSLKHWQNVSRVNKRCIPQLQRETKDWVLLMPLRHRLQYWGIDKFSIASIIIEWRWRYLIQLSTQFLLLYRHFSSLVIIITVWIFMYRKRQLVYEIQFQFRYSYCRRFCTYFNYCCNGQLTGVVWLHEFNWNSSTVATRHINTSFAEARIFQCD